ncbi:MAG: copper homeostasis periplasmic binding protein CopC [Steroidobacteraceae bacterium]
MITTKTLRRAAALAGITATLLVAASQASAQAKLESTTPKAESTVNSPNMIVVHFSESIKTKLSSLKLTMGDGTAVSVMSMNDTKDPATLSIMPNTTLKAGIYKVTWSVVSDDGHKTQGSFSFTVQ